VRDFANTIAAGFPTGSKGAQAVAKINQLVEQVNALDASFRTNARTARAGTSAKTDVSGELEEMLRAFKRTARAVGMDDPEVKNKFRLPAGALSQQALVSTARSFMA